MEVRARLHQLSWEQDSSRLGATSRAVLWVKTLWGAGTCRPQPFLLYSCSSVFILHGTPSQSWTPGTQSRETDADSKRVGLVLWCGLLVALTDTQPWRGLYLDGLI